MGSFKRRGCPSISVSTGLSQTLFRCWGVIYPNIFPNIGFSSVKSTEGADRFQRSHSASGNLRTPPPPNLLPSDPLSAPLGQVLTLGNQTLVDRAGQQGDAVLADLVAEAHLCLWCAPEARGTIGSDCSCLEGARNDTQVQHSEPSWSGTALPLLGDRVHHHCSSTDPLPAGKRHRPLTAGTGGRTTRQLDPRGTHNAL